MTLFQAFGQFAGAGGGVAVKNLDFISNTTFSAQADVGIDGVFSADYDYYMIHASLYFSAVSTDVLLQLRTGGSNATGSNYNRQSSFANNTTLSASRSTGNSSVFFQQGDGTAGNSAYRNYVQAEIAHPYAAVKTRIYDTQSQQLSSAIQSDYSGHIHTLTTSYDGFRIFCSSGTATGTLQVYGWKK